MLTLAKDLCHLPAETGEGQNYVARWYYDTKETRCRQFYYLGSGGNKNNFADEQSCTDRCKNQAPPPEPPRHVPEPEQRPEQRQEQRPEETEERKQASPHEERPSQTDQSICRLESDSGPCRTAEARWYYNYAEGLCDRFAYGGCDGNQNNFLSAEECEQNCGSVREACSVPAVYGKCRENVTRWHYDSASKECHEFAYSGCRGNKNNFYSKVDCLIECRQKDIPNEIDNVKELIFQQTTFNLTKLYFSLQRLGDDDNPCTTRADPGNCHEEILSYFYDSQRQICRQFYYTGCGGTSNRFDTSEQCENQCKVQPERNQDSQRQGDICERRRSECNSLQCPYGIYRSYDESNCEICQCEDPCREYNCEDGSSCVIEINSSSDGSEFTPSCRESKNICFLFCSIKCLFFLISV